MFLHIEDVRLLGGYRLRLDFTDGVTKDVDLSRELYGEIFEPLRDERVFASVAVNRETGTVEWPNGADFAPEFLYDIGVPVARVA